MRHVGDHQWVRGARRHAASLIAGALAAVVLVAVAVPVSAQDIPFGSSATFRISEVELDGRRVRAVVSTPPRLSGRDLPADAFTVYEKGKKRKATVRKLDPRLLEVAVVIDPGVSRSRLFGLRSAVAELVLTLPRSVGVGIVVAAERPEVVVPVSRDDTEVIAGLADIRPAERSSAVAGVDATLDLFSDGAGVRRTVVVLGPGRWTASRGADRLGERLEQGGVDIYSVASAEEAVGTGSVPVPLPLGGGRSRIISRSGIVSELDDIGRELVSQHEITFEAKAASASTLTVRFKAEGVDERASQALALPIITPPDPPSDRSHAFAWLALAAVGIGLMALVLYVPRRWVRGRAARSPDPAPPGGLAHIDLTDTGGTGRRTRSRVPAGVGVGIGGAREPGASNEGLPAGGTALATGAAGDPIVLTEVTGGRHPSGSQVEGREAVVELLRAGRRSVRAILLPDDVVPHQDVVELAAARRVALRPVPRSVFDATVRSLGPDDVIALAGALAEVSVESLGRRAVTDRRLLLCVEGPTSPTNLGGVLHVAASSGVSGVVLTRDRAGAITPITATIAAGALDRLDIAVVGGFAASLRQLQRSGVVLVGVDPEGQGLAAVDPELLEGPVALVIPTAGRLGRATSERCDAVVSVGDRGNGTSGVIETTWLACSGVTRRRQRAGA